MTGIGEDDAPAARTGGLIRILGTGFGLAVIVGSTLGVGILRTPGLVAAQLASFTRVAASSAPAGMRAKSVTPFAPSVAMTRCVSRPSLASRDSSGPMTRSSSG